jgi:ketosteroid isomerase-like protein
MPANKTLAALGALALTLLASACATAPATIDRAAIAETIKSDVAEIVSGINAHDVDRATQFDAPDRVSMESMREPSIGADADREGLAMVFKYAPSWHLELIDETVDVAGSGDMAVYRSTYNENSVDHDVPMTHKVNYIAEFVRQADASWKITSSVVCAQQRSHPQ